jgi:AcrR family transcriptional regulator
MEQPRKEHLIATAAALFNRRGFHQSGIDDVMRESGVSKTTLYKYFASKEDLILEVLKRRSNALLALLDERIENDRSKYPDKQDVYRIGVVLDVIEEWITSDSFFGCNFARASSEYYATDHPIHRFVFDHKARIKAIIAGLLTAKPAPKPETTAEQVMLVLDGAITAAQVRHRKDAIATARTIIAAILHAGG